MVDMACLSQITTIVVKRRYRTHPTDFGENPMNLNPWREIAVPHEDVLKGTFHFVNGRF